jgi:hypothetical protein
MRRQKDKDWPWEITYLYAMCITKTPVGLKSIEAAKKYKEYWNLAGEFDPMFEYRNIFYNLYRIVQRKLKYWWFIAYTCRFQRIRPITLEELTGIPGHKGKTRGYWKPRRTKKNTIVPKGIGIWKQLKQTI